MKDIQEFNNFTKIYSLDFLDLKDDILGNPKSQVGQYAKQLFDKYQIFDDCNEEYMNDNQKKICKNEMVRNVQEVATYQAYKDNLSSVSTKLGDLSQKLANSKDIKESQDIQNAIQMEIAQFEVAKAQVELMDTQNKSLKSIEQRQKEQLYKQNRTKQADWK
jgi:type IV secretion system protein VirB5